MAKDKSKIICGETILNDRTINLAKGHDAKTKMLVYEKKYPAKPFCGAQLPVGVKATPKSAKRIRMCTAQDMVKACPPVMCDCPPPKPPLTLMGYVTKGLGLGFKSMIAGAVVYWTYEMGVWGDSNQTEELYTTMKETFVCSDGKSAGAGDPASVERKVFQSRQTWNRAISYGFRVLNCLTNRVTKQLSLIIGTAPVPCPEPEEPKKK